MARTPFIQYVVLTSASFLLPLAIPSELSATQPPSPSPPMATSPAQTLMAFDPIIPSPKKSRGGGRRLFEPPEGQDAPGTTRGGGRRTDEVCPQDRPQNPPPSEKPQRKDRTVNELLTPLLPENRWGLTVSGRPTFLVYIPKTSARSLEFTLEEETGNAGSQFNLPIPESPGVVRITLPDNVPELAVGKEYAWRVTFVCQSTVPAPEDPFVQGTIRRVPSTTDPTRQSGKATTLEEVKQLAQAGIWYDASAGLAALKWAKPNDPVLNSTWQELLGDVGLDLLSTAPLRN